jgi:NADH dehydrogenase
MKSNPASKQRVTIASAFRRDILLGAVSGLIGGSVFAWGLVNQDMMVKMAGFLGVDAPGAGILLHLLLSALLGAAFGTIFRYHPDSYATSISFGVLFGLLAWIIVPLTISPILVGMSPEWSASEAAAAFPFLIGYLLFGAVTGLSFYVLQTLAVRWQLLIVPTIDNHREKPIHIVILGGGFGGVAAAQRLEKLTGGRKKSLNIETTLVSQSNYLLFTPMLAEVAGSSLVAQNISAPVRAACPNTRFLRAAVELIDPETQTVSVRRSATQSPETIPFDHLVLALGAVPNFYGLPGMQEHSYSLKTLEDATRLRNHVISLLERADVEIDGAERDRQLTFVVAGGGFAGTEIAAELFDLVHSIIRYYPNIEPDELRFVLIHAQNRILPELSPELADYSLKKLRARGIEFILEARVSAATNAAVSLKDGRSIPTYTIVWTAGNQPSPTLNTLPNKRNSRGAIMVESTLRVKDASNLWAIGDCAQIPDALQDGKFYPPTAQHALREGKLVAENIVAVLERQEPKPFRFRSFGLLVALGHRTGVAELMGLRFSGFLAWLMWRSIYLSKLPVVEKKVRVLLDWLLDLFFARDIVLTVDTSISSEIDSGKENKHEATPTD